MDRKSTWLVDTVHLKTPTNRPSIDLLFSLSCILFFRKTKEILLLFHSVCLLLLCWVLDSSRIISICWNWDGVDRSIVSMFRPRALSYRFPTFWQSTIWFWLFFDSRSSDFGQLSMPYKRCSDLIQVLTHSIQVGTAKQVYALLPLVLKVDVRDPCDATKISTHQYCVK